jgi:hypothetical protein
MMRILAAVRSWCMRTVTAAMTLSLLCWILGGTRPALAGEVPPAEIMQPIDALAQFMAQLPAGRHATMFAARGVTIVENYAPYIFSGADAVAAWEAGFRQHAGADELSELKVRFGPARDFSVQGERAYLSLPTTWTGRTHGTRFEEHGAWAFVLSRRAGQWKVLGYGWGVTRYSESKATPTSAN